MTWHLKDRELEEALNKKSHPNHTFTDRLNEVMAKIPKKGFSRVVGCAVKFQRIGTGGIIHTNNVIEFSIEEIENVPDYNPKDWNDYPKVIPPQNVVMRCEIYTERYDTYTPEPKGGELVDRTSGVWNGHGWDFNSLNHLVPDNWTIRYRPWED